MKKEKKFDKVYAENHKYVRNFCQGLLSGSKIFELDDIVQNTFIKVFKNFDKFDKGKASIRTWICTIAKNETFDHFRRSRQNRVFIDIPLDDAESGIRGIVDNKLYLDKDQLEEEQKIFEARIADTMSALRSLSKKQRSIIKMHYLSGIEYQKISKKMRTSTASARWMSKRGIDKIKTIVGGVR